MRKRLLLIAAGLLWPSLAFAQTTYKQTVNGSQPATVNIGTLTTKCVYSGTTSLVIGQAIPFPCTIDGKVAVDATASIDVTATATPPVTAPGSGAPLNSDLFGGLWVAPEFAGQLVDITHGLPVDCVSGCAGGSFNNNADGVATSSTNGQSASWLYVWNGTTWDRVRGDVTDGAWVNVKASVLPTGAATAANQGLPYPPGAVPVTASTTGTTGATTATLAASTLIHTYICGYSIRANADAAATGNATVTGTTGGTLNFTQWTAPSASGLGINEQVFIPCIPSSAINTAIAVISAAPGTGGVVSVSAWGFQL